MLNLPVMYSVYFVQGTLTSWSACSHHTVNPFGATWITAPIRFAWVLKSG